MSFGGLPFVGGHVGNTQEVYLKYTRNAIIQVPDMSQEGGGPQPGKLGPKTSGDEAQKQTKPT